ncbi:MAG: hypothetical protein JWL77_4682 [Chthonomonadaceae bacterium]|nr:hypothetical protein [Chthonomonadaceae bacterium]
MNDLLNLAMKAHGGLERTIDVQARTASSQERLLHIDDDQNGVVGKEKAR